DESLGGARMHAEQSGLADHLAEDEHDAIRIGRRVVARLNHRKQEGTPTTVAPPPLYSEEELVGIMPPDLQVTVDPREVIARARRIARCCAHARRTIRARRSPCRGRTRRDPHRSARGGPPQPPEAGRDTHHGGPSTAVFGGGTRRDHAARPEGPGRPP